MVKILSAKEQLVDTICSEGCKFVNQFVSTVSLQQEHADLQGLSASDQKWVVEELRSIMKVYEQSGSCTI